MSSVFFNKGENCIAAGRLFVERSIHDEFLKRVLVEIGKMVTNRPPPRKSTNWNIGMARRRLETHWIAALSTALKTTRPTWTNWSSIVRRAWPKERVWLRGGNEPIVRDSSLSRPCSPTWRTGRTSPSKNLLDPSWSYPFSMTGDALFFENLMLTAALIAYL